MTNGYDLSLHRSVSLLGGPPGPEMLATHCLKLYMPFFYTLTLASVGPEASGTPGSALKPFSVFEVITDLV